LGKCTQRDSAVGRSGRLPDRQAAKQAARQARVGLKTAAGDDI
jgi:hypothetical protein